MMLRSEEDDESVYDLANGDTHSVTTIDTGVGDMYLDSDFLLLDIRTKEEFDECHIHGGAYSSPNIVFS